MSLSRPDIEKWHSLHKHLRTKAIASEKVGRSLAYQAAVRTTFVLVLINSCASRVTSENSASRAGVVRAIAKSLHCRSGLQAQIRPRLLEGHFHRPSLHESLQDLLR